MKASPVAKSSQVVTGLPLTQEFTGGLWQLFWTSASRISGLPGRMGRRNHTVHRWLGEAHPQDRTVGLALFRKTCHGQALAFWSYRFPITDISQRENIQFWVYWKRTCIVLDPLPNRNTKVTQLKCSPALAWDAALHKTEPVAVSAGWSLTTGSPLASSGWELIFAKPNIKTSWVTTQEY